MAVAGKAAITLDGAWSSTKDYDRLTGVVHNNSLFISRKKPPIGTAPSEGEYWMLCIEGVNEQDLDALAARVQVVENNYFPKTGGQLEGELKVRNANNGFGRFFKNNSASADYGVNLVDYASSNKSITLILSALNDLFQYKDSAGNFNNILHSGNYDDYAVPKHGGTISGVLTLDSKDDYNNLHLKTVDGYIRSILAGSDRLRLEVKKTTDDSNRRLLDLFSDINGTLLKQAFRMTEFVNGVGTEYNIFGQHNKPNGSYTGNGSATSRNISIGGIGQVLHITSPVIGCHLLVSYSGAIVCLSNGNVVGLSYDNCSFSGGVLRISSNNAYINSNGSAYHYQLL